MTLQRIKERLAGKSIFYSEDEIMNKPTVWGYHKQFRWKWVATQLNTFIAASDFGDETITVRTIEGYLGPAFDYASTHYTGWPRGFQSGVGLIALLLSSHIDTAAIDYCKQLKAGKKWAGFAVPVVIDSSSNQVYCFDKNPVWGALYYPYFKEMIQQLTQKVTL